MDQGVIKCLKAHYRRRLVRLMIQRLDQGQDLPKISIFLALQLLVASWNNVGKATIVNCFRKAKISAENQVDALEDSNDPFKALQENLTELRQSNPDLVPDELSVALIIDIDSSLTTTDAPTTDKEILESVQLEEEEMDEDDGIEIFDEPVAMPTSIEVGNALETLQNLISQGFIFADLAISIFFPNKVPFVSILPLRVLLVRLMYFRVYKIQFFFFFFFF